MWFNSKLLEELQETNENATIYDCLSYNVRFKEHIQDLIVLNVTKENYKILIELCDFLMIDNVDEFIVKIVKIHDYDYNIIYEFEDFYKYNTKRLIPLDILENAIELYCKDHKLCFHTYEFSSFWDVSSIEDMYELFSFSFYFNSYKFLISFADLYCPQKLIFIFGSAPFSINFFALSFQLRLF